MSEPFLDIRHLRKSFDGAEVYGDLTLAIEKPGIVAVFGPNGCGKSTLLQLMAGLQSPEGGRLRLCGHEGASLNAGFVFQSYREALFPWLNAFDNIGYPLRVRGLGRSAATRQVEAILAAFNIGFDPKLYPYQLSGGQQQLVAILRALVMKPDAVLLDEPFSALDFETKILARDRLQDMLGLTQTPAILVSHDIEEAVYLADWIVLLSRRPSRVACVIPCSLPRPRTPDIMHTPDFSNLCATCLDFFRRVAWS